MKNKYRNELISLTEEDRRKLREEIHAFYLDERGEDIGIIRQEQILDLFLERLAPFIYNRALDDAKRWHQHQMENIENDYYLLYRDGR